MGIAALLFVICLGTSVIGAICGIGGGMLRRKLNKRLDNAAVDRLFMGLMAVIILISVYNIFRYAA